MGPNRLEYIATVDIFNEGVDIPEVNQILMLRRTESAIVFCAAARPRAAPCRRQGICDCARLYRKL